MFNFSQFYKVLFESAICDEEGIKFLNSDHNQQIEVIKLIFRSMNDKIVSRNEDVIQTIDVLEYFIKIITDIPNKALLTYALGLLNEVLKGDFVIQGERPFKSFYWVVFYLCNGFKQLHQVLQNLWLPLEIQIQGKKLKSSMNINNTASYKNNAEVFGQNIFENLKQDSSRRNQKCEIPSIRPLMAKNNTLRSLELDWDFYDQINAILEYTNVVLNDLEIFSAPEIYSSILRSYQHVLPGKAIDIILNSIYKITIDKNHRISNGRYNAMFSKDFIKTFSNIFCLYWLNVTSTDQQSQWKYFNLLMKLIYHNILLVNEKTLWSQNLSANNNSLQDITSFFQMNRGKGIVKDRTTNRNVKKILLQNPSIFDDLQLCFVKLGQNSKELGDEIYKERMIQIIFIFVYMLISWKDQKEIDPIEIIVQSKDYLFKSPHTIKYGMLLFMLLFGDRYNKSSFDFKKAFINSENGIDSLIMKLNESRDEEELMRNIYLVCLISLETSQELKIKVISKIDLLRLFDNIRVDELSLDSQK